MAPRLSAPACAAFLAIASTPGLAFAFDLAQAFQEALANDALVASARSQLAATREKVPQAQAGLLPAANANAAMSRQYIDTNLSPSREFTSQNYSVSMSYPLYRLQNVETLEQSKLSVAIGEAQLALAQQDLMLRVSQAYFDVLGAQDNLETIRAQKRAITEQLASAKRNFEVGTATITDQQEAQARFDLVVAQEFAALNDLEVKRAALGLLIGKPTPELKVLRPGVRLQPTQPAREVEWTNSARSDNLTVQQARVAAEIAGREIDKQRYAFRPNIDLVGSLGYSKSATSALVGVNAASASVGVQLTMPLYTAGGIDARIREAIALRDKSQSDLENARRVAEQAARQAFLSVNSGLSQVTALEAAEKSSQLALDSNLLGYQVGVRINIDVLNAQQQLFTTRRDLAKARYDVLLNGLRLKSTAAALSVDDLRAIGGLLDTPKSGSPGQASVTPVAPPAMDVRPSGTGSGRR